MKKNILNQKSIIIAASILIILLIAVSIILSYFKITGEIFNNVTTPLLALFSIVVLIFTLMKSQEFNKEQLKLTDNQLIIDEYKILLDDFNLIKTKLEELKFDLKMKDMPLSFTKHLPLTNGISYIDLFHDYNMYFNSPKTFTPTEKDHELTIHFRSGIIFPLVKNYNDIEIFIKEVINNKLLDDRYKRKLYLKVEQQLLQHYLTICNNCDSSNNLEYNLEAFKSEGFNTARFYSLNNLFIDKDLFQIHNLAFYKENN